MAARTSSSISRQIGSKYRVDSGVNFTQSFRGRGKSITTSSFSRPGRAVKTSDLFPARAEKVDKKQRVNRKSVVP
jgi:hypothetical protein